MHKKLDLVGQVTTGEGPMPPTLLDERRGIARTFTTRLPRHRLSGRQREHRAHT